MTYLERYGSNADGTLFDRLPAKEDVRFIRLLIHEALETLDTAEANDALEGFRLAARQLEGAASDLRDIVDQPGVDLPALPVVFACERCGTTGKPGAWHYPGGDPENGPRHQRQTRGGAR